jgi:DNA-binding transcriptional MerR regulator
MQYKIKEAARIMNLPTTTIRYYEKEGLVPFVQRKESGYRIFAESDLAMLKAIECLKNTGMSIKEIRQFVEWVKQGDDSLQQRYELFLDRKRVVENQMAELQENLDLINKKCWYYETAIEAGTEAIHAPPKLGDELPCMKE